MSIRLNKPAEISDDDDSFEDPSASGLQNMDEDVFSISSDDTAQNETNISEDDSPISNPKTNEINVPNEERDRVIRNIFSCSTVNNEVALVKDKKPAFVRMIGGVQVTTPVEPYGCQVALMFKVISGISKRENCLLESPTGSGKTLALLCAALAWQKHERERLDKLYEQRSAFNYQSLTDDYGASSFIGNNSDQRQNLFAKAIGVHSIYDNPSASNMKMTTRPLNKNQVNIHKKRKIETEDGSSSSRTEDINMSDGTSLLNELESDGYQIPTIYYGARTHKQIQQVIKEFRRTTYCGLAKMTILSSREYSCIRPYDRKIFASKNDMCRECCSSKSKDTSGPKENKTKTNCKFFDNREKLTHKELPDAFDLEDLVSAGERLHACPYYGARSMAAAANIVFCPYNYLIDPSIRSSLQINVKNEIVILDEAHNIEDICRDVATYTLKKEDFLNSLKEIEIATQYLHANSEVQDDLKNIQRSLNCWVQWFQNQNVLLNQQAINKEVVHKFDVEFFVETLDRHNIGRNHFNAFAKSAEVLCALLRDNASASKLYGITHITAVLVETIANAMSYLFREEGKFIDDFKPALVKTLVETYEAPVDALGWKSSKGEMVEKAIVSLRLMCMNPAVVFSGLSEARTILLASGTLTPLLSLHSELGTVFPNKISPPHVIPRERVWVGTLATCPNGAPLECQMKKADMIEIQDALGAAVLWVSRVTPHGVLCFLPSYTLMNKLIQRWKATGVWNELEQQKHIFVENRNVRDHNDIMEAYYEYANTSKGALLFAVFRGKVSEGMDFKDQQARAVVTIGIPYPNVFDMMVDEKMKYNDRHSNDRNLLSSKEWLRVQAYRALNQAVGRCVRHRGDWGAVLMIDARFKNKYYTEHLSSWVRNFLGNNHHTFDSLVNSPNSLAMFMQAMKINSEEDILM